jgi:hypothetical protein
MKDHALPNGSSEAASEGPALVEVAGRPVRRRPNAADRRLAALRILSDAYRRGGGSQHEHDELGL